MSSESLHLTLGELISRFGGSIKTGPFGTALKAAEYSTHGVPLISVREIHQGGFRIDKSTPRVTAATTARLPEYVLREGDIVFARKGSVERCCIVGKEQDGWFLGSDGIRLRLPNVVDSRFLTYQLQSSKSAQWLQQHSTGSTMASLNQEILSRVPVLLPSFDEQQKVADFLSGFNDKIEILNRMNGTLESMALALHQSWFVDFDPVHALRDGRQSSSMPTEAAALFPDRFEESQLGLIPKGWRVASVHDVAEVVYGAPFSSKMFNSQGMGRPLIRIRDLATGTPGVFTQEVHPRGRLVQPGELLVGMDGEFVPHMWLGEPAWLNQRVCLFSPKDMVSVLWLKHVLAPHLRFFERAKVGTTVIHLGKQDIDQIQLLVPSQGVMAAFTAFTEPLRYRIVHNSTEVRTLQRLRDTLLPGLIAGQLRIPDADKALEEAL